MLFLRDIYKELEIVKITKLVEYWVHFYTTFLTKHWQACDLFTFHQLLG